MAKHAFDGGAFDSVAFDVELETRAHGSKLIAAYTIDDNGKLRRKMDALIEREREQVKEDEEMAAALLAYWRMNE